MSETIFLSKAVDPSGRIAAERRSSMLDITRSPMGGERPIHWVCRAPIQHRSRSMRRCMSGRSSTRNNRPSGSRESTLSTISTMPVRTRTQRPAGRRNRRTVGCSTRGRRQIRKFDQPFAVSATARTVLDTIAIHNSASLPNPGRAFTDRPSATPDS